MIFFFQNFETGKIYLPMIVRVRDAISRKNTIEYFKIGIALPPLPCLNKREFLFRV